MALLTPEERQPFVKRGLYPKHKCDYDQCGRAILSPVSYTGTRGSYCSVGCLNGAEGSGLRGSKRKDDENEDMATATTKDKKVKRAADGAKTKESKMAKDKSTKASPKDEDVKKKKKAAASEDERPAKSKKDKGNDAKSSKAAKASKGDKEDKKPKKSEPAEEGEAQDIPFKPDSGIGRVFRMLMNGGAMRQKVEAFCEKNGIDLKWALTHIGKGKRQLSSGSWTWKLLKKDDGRLKIVKLECN